MFNELAESEWEYDHNGQIRDNLGLNHLENVRTLGNSRHTTSNIEN